MKKQKEKIDVLVAEGDDILVVHRKENPNSYEVGKPGNRFKIFFETAEDLKKQVEKLEEQGFIPEEKD